MTKDLLLEIVMSALPYPTQVRDIDTVSEPDAIRFTWREHRFRVSIRLDVSLVDEERLVHGTDVTLLLGHVLSMARARRSFAA